MARGLDDLTGNEYGYLTVIGYAYKQGSNHKWRCRCICGKEVDVLANGLRTGKRKSCGCRKTEGVTKHGMFGTPTYRSWEGMKSRCFNQKDPYYRDYGGRGITVCDRWATSDGFVNFLADMGERPANRTLDRIDFDGDYTPENCRWATIKQQARNRRDNVRILFEGEYLVLSALEEKTGISRSFVNYWRRRGFTDSEIEICIKAEQTVRTVFNATKQGA